MGRLGLFALLTAAAAAAVSPMAHAASEVLTGISSDAFPGKLFSFSITTDAQSDATSMGYAEDPQAPQNFAIDELRNGKVIMHNDPHNTDVITLLSTSLDSQQGGEIRLHYLANGLSHVTRDFVMYLTRSGGRWELTHDVCVNRNCTREPFTHLFFKGNFFLGQLIGISRIIAN